MVALKTKQKRNRSRVSGSIRDIGATSIAIDVQTKKRLKVISGNMPMSLWLRRDIDKHYRGYVNSGTEKIVKAVKNGQN